MYKEYRTCIFRIYPNKIQKEKINNNIKSASKIYNIILNYERKSCKEYKAYMLECKRNNITPNFIRTKEINKIPTISQIKKMPQYKYLKKADYIALDSALINIMNGYKMFFKGYNNFRPKFKSIFKANKYTTRCINNNVRFKKESIRLPKIGFVKCKIHRDISEFGNIVKVTIKTINNKKFFICVTFLKLKEEKESRKIYKAQMIGIDFNINNIYVDNNYNKEKHLEGIEKLLNNAEKIYKKLKGKIYHSRRWIILVNKMRIKYEKIKNIRKNNLYLMSKRIIANNYYIGIEDISIKQISKNIFDRNKLYDCCFKKFIKILQYKLQEKYGDIIKIDKWFKSSKICSFCGNIKDNLLLTERIYKCNNCGNILDRDLNAAINIKNEAIRILIKKGKIVDF